MSSLFVKDLSEEHRAWGMEDCGFGISDCGFQNKYKAEDGGQKSEVRSQRSEVRRQILLGTMHQLQRDDAGTRRNGETEIRGQKAACVIGHLPSASFIVFVVKTY